MSVTAPWIGEGDLDLADHPAGPAFDARDRQDHERRSTADGQCPEATLDSASLQDLVQRHLASDGQLRGLASKAAVQLNDTHPSLAVTELMRILVDLHNFRWDEAWKITVATLSYTNHTLLPEALET